MCKPRKAESDSAAGGEAAAAAAGRRSTQSEGWAIGDKVSSRSQTLLALILMSKEVTSLPLSLALASLVAR